MRSRYRTDEGRRVVVAWCRERLAETDVAHEERSVETGAGSSHLLVAGRGGATVLLLPGTDMAAATSLPLVRALVEEGLRVVVADLPDQPGLSDADLPRRHRMTAYGTWAGQVVERLRHESPQPGPLVVVGHSLGAAVALAMPTAGVAALVLVDPAGLVRLRVGRRVLAATLPWVLRPTPARSRALLEQLTGPGHPPSAQLVEWFTLVARCCRPVGAPGPLPGAVLDRWRGTPVHVLSGEHDCFLPPDALAAAARDRLGTALTVLPGLGHLAVDEDPDAVARAVAEVARPR
ncbi:alpha/beta fold hydrolase [Aquipuribacter sp. SD81]|uniref:alpha/beta fold hydrolase n=1 Tax=Aquipuribacter sp. SD81 TaxID=3127703 RepID=UPI003019EDD9